MQSLSCLGSGFRRSGCRFWCWGSQTVCNHNSPDWTGIRIIKFVQLIHDWYKFWFWFLWCFIKPQNRGADKMCEPMELTRKQMAITVPGSEDVIWLVHHSALQVEASWRKCETLSVMMTPAIFTCQLLWHLYTVCFFYHVAEHGSFITQHASAGYKYDSYCAQRHYKSETLHKCDIACSITCILFQMSDPWKPEINLRVI